MYAQTTDKLYKGLWSRTASQLRQDLEITPKENPRDHFGKYALIYTRLAEELASERLNESETVTMTIAMNIVWEVARLFYEQAKELSEAVGYDLVTEKPLLPKKKAIIVNGTTILNSNDFQISMDKHFQVNYQLKSPLSPPPPYPHCVEKGGETHF